MTIEITFAGGPIDGVVRLHDFSTDHQPEELLERYAWIFYNITRGDVGAGMVGLSPAMMDLFYAPPAHEMGNIHPQQHEYVIENRTVAGDCVLIFARYVTGAQ